MMQTYTYSSHPEVPRPRSSVRSRLKRSVLTWLLALLCPLLSLAQTFTAKVDDVGGYYRLTFTVTSSDASAFTPPSLADFDVLSGPNTSTFSNYQYINGRTSHTETTSFTYILSAKKAGTITIGAASVRVGNKVLRSRPITLKAQAGTNANGSHNGASNPARSGGGGIDMNQVQQAGSAVSDRDLFIDVTPSRTRVREQEAVLLTYRVHARVGVGLANTSLTSKPDFKGLISQEIPLPGNQIQTSLEHRNGTTYKTGTILQYVIFPQQSGRLTVPSITFDCTVVQQDHSMDLADAFFNGGGTIGVAVKRKVPVTTIEVEKLPEPRPANFSGAVGTFSLTGKVLSPTVKTNEVTTYRITLNGLGNLKLITPPNVAFPKDFDTYEAKTNDQTKVTADGLNGQLTFDYTFVPRNVGKYTIPAVEFVYFDTEKGSYQTLRTAPVTLDIAKGERSNEDVDKQLALLKSDIRPLRTSSGASFLTWGTWPFRFTCIGLLVFLIAAYFLVRRNAASKFGNGTQNRRRGAQKRAVRSLREAEKLKTTGDAAAYYAAVSRAIRTFISDAFGLQPADINADTLRETLATHHIAAEQADQLLRVFETCQYAQYAPGGADLREKVYQEALTALESIEIQTQRKH